MTVVVGDRSGEWYTRPVHYYATLRDRNDTIRLIVILLYILLVVPGLLFVRRGPDRFRVPGPQHALAIVGIAVYALLELAEFAISRYRYRHRFVIQALFLVRTAVIAAAVIDSFGVDARIRMHPATAALVPLLAFYTYFAFSRVLGYTLTGLFLIVPLTVGLLDRGWELGNERIGFLIYRSIIVVFFFTLAWLWDTERTRNRERSRLLHELHESEARLRLYAEEVGHTVALEERNRIARDLHDSIGHALTAITIQLNKAKAYFDVDTDQALAGIEAARTTAGDAMHDIRESLGHLRGDEADLDLRESVTRLVAQLEAAGVVTTFEWNGEDGGYNYAVRIAIYRFVQEAVTNILKHADASKATVSVTLGRDEATISVADNGRGFATTVPGVLGQDETPRPKGVSETRGAGFGLVGLQRRFELIRGSVTVQSRSGGGTVLDARAPRSPERLLGEEGDGGTNADR